MWLALLFSSRIPFWEELSGGDEFIDDEDDETGEDSVTVVTPLIPLVSRPPIDGPFPIEFVDIVMVEPGAGEYRAALVFADVFVIILVAGVDGAVITVGVLRLLKRCCCCCCCCWSTWALVASRSIGVVIK